MSSVIEYRASKNDRERRFAGSFQNGLPGGSQFVTELGHRVTGSGVPNSSNPEPTGPEAVQFVTIVRVPPAPLPTWLSPSGPSTMATSMNAASPDATVGLRTAK